MALAGCIALGIVLLTTRFSHFELGSSIGRDRYDRQNTATIVFARRPSAQTYRATRYSPPREGWRMSRHSGSTEK